MDSCVGAYSQVQYNWMDGQLNEMDGWFSAQVDDWMDRWLCVFVIVLMDGDKNVGCFLVTGNCLQNDRLCMDELLVVVKEGWMDGQLLDGKYVFFLFHQALILSTAVPTIIGFSLWREVRQCLIHLH